MRCVALAVGAHPDDVEFMMAGTLVLLGQAGYALHLMHLADGCCGSTYLSRDQTAQVRAKEARTAAEIIGATYHPSLVRDLEISYEPRVLRRLATVVRRINPTVLLVPSLEDYMEDHVMTARLAVTAAFARPMKNFLTSPRTRVAEGDCTVYHALPYGLRDALRQRIRPGLYVDVSGVLPIKRRMLACHRSQKEWLDKSQGVDSYIQAMEEMAGEVGRMSGRFRLAEGWHRRRHLGFSAREEDPLRTALGKKVVIDREYEERLENPR